MSQSPPSVYCSAFIKYMSVLCRPCALIRSLSQGSANAAVLDVNQTGGHKKRVRRSSFLNAKKLYEDAQMARKVKQYLSNLSLETNEESLQTLSLQCESSISTCEAHTQSHADIYPSALCVGSANVNDRVLKEPVGPKQSIEMPFGLFVVRQTAAQLKSSDTHFIPSFKM